MSYTPQFYKKILHSFRRFIAKKWLSNMSPLQIAVTGSQGKTTTTNILYHILKKMGSTVCTDLNLDTIYNVPITALHIKPWTRFALFELGVDHPSEMNTHLEIVKPKIAIITGISPVHTDKEHFGSFENLIKEKRKLIESLPSDGYAILNGDDENIRKMTPYTKAKVIFYGNKNTNNVFASNIRISLQGTSFTLNWNTINDVKLEQKSMQVSTHLIGGHHIYSIISSLITVVTIQKMLNLPVSLTRSIEVITKMKPLNGRMNIEEGPMGTMLLNDSLRANPASTSSGLWTLFSIEHTGKKIAILAEMGELLEPEKEHDKIGDLIALLSIDTIVLIGPLHKYTKDRAIQNGFNPQSIYWTENVIQASEVLKKLINKGDLIYLKGSLLRHVERVPMILNGQKVKCKIGICPFYHHCPECAYKEYGYSFTSHS